MLLKSPSRPTLRDPLEGHLKIPYRRAKRRTISCVIAA
jgi:hypothetical protein